jgi:hypothetical protein
MMKLTSAQVERALSQFEAEPIPEDHPALSQLSKIFGDHTFFIHPDGLHIVALTESKPGTQAGQVVKLASWIDAARTRLAPHEPEPTNVVILLAA